MSHHPACKPEDKTLGFLCAKCGMFEPCDVIEYTDDRLSVYDRPNDAASAVDNYGDLVPVPFILGAYYWQDA